LLASWYFFTLYYLPEPTELVGRPFITGEDILDGIFVSIATGLCLVWYRKVGLYGYEQYYEKQRIATEKRELQLKAKLEKQHAEEMAKLTKIFFRK
jgi:hypothetical protein